MLVMMQFWCSDCWSLVLYSQGDDSCDAFSGALGTIPKPSQPPFLPSFLAQLLEMGSGLYHVSSLSSTLSFYPNSISLSCLEFFLSRSHFVFTILLAKKLWKKGSQQSCRSCSSYQQVSDTTRSCSSDQQCQTQADHAQVIKNMSNTRSACSFTALQPLTNKPDCCPRELEYGGVFFFSGKFFSGIACLTSYFEEWVFEKSL